MAMSLLFLSTGYFIFFNSILPFSFILSFFLFFNAFRSGAGIAAIESKKSNNDN